MGAYPATEGVFLNPVSVVAGTGWDSSSIVWAYDETAPALRYPGSIGDAIYYGKSEGPFKDT